MSDNQFNFGPTVISNSLNDSSTTKALSAAKGKELSESIIKPITIDLDTVTNTSGSYTHTTTIATTGLITEGMKCIGLEVGNPAAFGDMPTITAGNDEITLSCSSVSGTSTVKVTMMRTTQAASSGIMPTAVTSEEFDILADRIGDIDDLTTTAKTDVVAAVNSLKTSSDEHNTAIGNMSYQITTLNTKIAMISESIQSNFNVVRFGRVVYLSCVGGSFNKDAENHITNSSNVVIRIPNGYRPVANAELWDCNGEKRITVDTDGYLASSASISSSALRFSGCWITNNAMPS